MMTAHIDTFARDNLPPASQWPDLVFDLPELQFNNLMLAACWFAVIKAGGIAVPTMPLLRARELTQIAGKAKITHALCDDAALVQTQTGKLQRFKLHQTAPGTDPTEGAR